MLILEGRNLYRVEDLMVEMEAEVDTLSSGNAQLWTLLHLKYRKHVIAEPGQGGMGALKSGKEGEDIILEVPLGTIAKDAETGKFIVRLLRMAKSIFWFLEDAGIGKQSL